MSVIYNALKKTQESRSQHREPRMEQTMPIAAELSSELNRKMRQGVLLTSLTVIVITIAFIGLKHLSYQAPLKKTPLELPAPILAKTEALKLTGVFLSGSTKMAMINNHTYLLGEKVHGKKIVSIEIDHVKLQEGNIKETLYTIA